jgi:hypothetical protein
MKKKEMRNKSWPLVCFCPPPVYVRLLLLWPINGYGIHEHEHVNLVNEHHYVRKSHRNPTTLRSKRIAATRY